MLRVVCDSRGNPMRVLHLPELTPAAEEKLSTVGDPYVWQRIVADIAAGRSQLFLCPNDTYIVLRIEGDELIFVAAVGSDSSGLLELALDIARVHSLKFIRFHTARKGLARLVKKYNPIELHTVYRIPVQ